MQIQNFVDESHAVDYVAKQLGISWAESEKLYSDIGGYQGDSVTINQYSREDTDPFTLCILAFMDEKGIESLTLQYDD